MNPKELSLIELFWTWQRDVHTKPGLRPYLHALIEQMRAKGIKAEQVNAVGLKLVESGQHNPAGGA